MLAWRGPNSGESDVYALAAILSTAAVITVPLLNWSRSLRDLSLKKRSDDNDDHDDEQDFSRARSIVIYWGFLVAVGLFSALVLIVGATNGILFDIFHVVHNASISCVQSGSPSEFDSLEFEGLFNITSTFIKNGTTVEFPVIYKEWMTTYGCSNPCGYIPRPAIFRSIDEYTLMTFAEFTNQLNVAGYQSSRDRLNSDFQNLVVVWSRFVFPFIIVQGIWTAIFGRRSPTQIRDTVYLFLRDRRPLRSLGVNPRKLVAKLVALSVYLWALFVTIICLPVLIITIVAVETWLHRVPQAESANHIGAWSPWAGTALALIAVFIGRYERPFVNLLHRLRNGEQSWHDFRQRSGHSAANGFRRFRVPIVTFLFHTPSSEWQSFYAFWKDADSAKYYNRHGKLRESLGQPRHAATMPAEMTTIVPRKSWWNSRFDTGATNRSAESESELVEYRAQQSKDTTVTP